MKRVKLIISYDGTNYCGWQRQNNQSSVQQVIENRLSEFTKEDITIHASGRTDTNVHAFGQVAHFDTQSVIPAENFSGIMNSLLPEDIKVLSSTQVDESFHARFSAVSKHYRYLLDNTRMSLPIYRNYHAATGYKLDFDLMQLAAEKMLGIHDFKGFMSVHCPMENTERIIYRSELEKDDSLITYNIEGNGFLRHMVRIIMGTLIDIGRGRMPIEQIDRIFKEKDRMLAGKTADAKGLILVSVKY